MHPDPSMCVAQVHGHNLSRHKRWRLPVRTQWPAWHHHKGCVSLAGPTSASGVQGNLSSWAAAHKSTLTGCNHLPLMCYEAGQAQHGATASAAVTGLLPVRSSPGSPSAYVCPDSPCNMQAL